MKRKEGIGLPGGLPPGRKGRCKVGVKGQPVGTGFFLQTAGKGHGQTQLVCLEAERNRKQD